MENKNVEYAHIIPSGRMDIYTDPLVTQPVFQSGAIEKPFHEDVRGFIERKDYAGTKFNIIKTVGGYMRSGDLHKNAQFDLIFSGKLELWTLENGTTEKRICGHNELIVINPHVPHLFNFLEDTIMAEWWDGPFEAWFYKPYRDIVEENFKQNNL